jgi:hypothetical protein
MDEYERLQHDREWLKNYHKKLDEQYNTNNYTTWDEIFIIFLTILSAVMAIWLIIEMIYL